MAGRKPTIEDTEFLRAFVEAEEPVLGTAELADKFSFSNQGVAKRLNDLEDRGLVASKNLGNAKAWWITDAGREELED